MLSLLESKLKKLETYDIVIEAVAEDLENKKDLLGQMSEYISPYALVGSNTSSLSVTGLPTSVLNPASFEACIFSAHHHK
jgi:3-hydroxyacyl-CoA dehydrogenase